MNNNNNTHNTAVFQNSNNSNSKKAPSIYDFLPVTGIGAGAFAQVFHGYERLNPYDIREVALKRINFDAIKLDFENVKKATMNEVALFKALDHKNIVKCYNSFEETSGFTGKKYFVLVLEYVNGGDLQDWLTRRIILNYYYTIIPEREIWKIFSQIAEAVAYIHSKNIMHRDLKPANVLMTYDNQVKLADFGLSRLQANGESRAKTVCGTPYYMSPERIHEQPYSFKSDVWALGCILYEMAALRSPFYGEKYNVPSLIQKISDSEYPPLPQDCYSPQLVKLMEMCLISKMSKRPPSKEVCRVAAQMDYIWNKLPALLMADYQSNGAYEAGSSGMQNGGNPVKGCTMKKHGGLRGAGGGHGGYGGTMNNNHPANGVHVL